VTIETADAVFKGAAAKYTATATLLGDQEADVEQTGSGISPIFSVNISPSENLNIAVKYEMATKMELVNKTTKDLLLAYTALGQEITMFPDGEKTPSDMPAMLSAGLDYKLGSAATLSLGTNLFLDKGVDYGHKLDLDNNSSTPSTPVSNEDIIDSNGLSLMAGLEYHLSDKLLVSGGYVWANKGVNSSYQSDLTYGLATQTIGVGGAYNLMEKMRLNVGFSYTIYTSDEKTINHVFAATGQVIPALETYCKNAMIFAVGLDWSF
jgi:long-subunit fatty acid transport protein